MRTVDPELWSRKVKKPEIQVSRRLRFGQHEAPGLEHRLRRSLLDAAEEFGRNSSLGGLKYFNIDRMNKYERCRHIIMLVLTLVLGIGVTAYNCRVLHALPPLIVTHQYSGNPIANSQFPAVALCSNNVISRTALNKFTRYLYTHPKNRLYGYNESEIESNLVNLGALLTLALPPVKVKFEKFFRDVEPNFNISDIMFKLSSNCSKILKRCSWRGRLKDCDSMFASRLTALGFCCVFNSRYQPPDVGREPATLDLIGQNYGLGVVIKEDRNDFSYVRRPAYGMELLLFAGDEYPLIESGDVRMYPLPRNASLFFKIRTYKQEPADDILYYSEEWRGCRIHGGGMSWCLAECRRDTAAALCGCVPYALQPQATPPAAPACTLSELSCLNKYREKFMYLFPGDDAHPSLSEEVQDALDCSHCRVLCRRQLYSAEISYSDYAFKPLIFRNFLSENLELINGTTIRMFYNEEDQGWYRVEALARWYELFIKLSSHWMVVTGVSMLCCSEFVYHFTFRWISHFIRRTTLHRTANQGCYGAP